MNKRQAKCMKMLEGLMGALVLIIWLVVVVLVVLRYIFNSSIPGANEWIVILFVYATSIGAALGIGRGSHLSIEFAIAKCSPPNKRRVDILNTALVGMLHVAIILLSMYWISVTGHFLMPSTGLPRWVAQISIPIGGLLGFIFCSLRFWELCFNQGETDQTNHTSKSHAKGDTVSP